MLQKCKKEKTRKMKREERKNEFRKLYILARSFCDAVSNTKVMRRQMKNGKIIMNVNLRLMVWAVVVLKMKHLDVRVQIECCDLPYLINIR